MDDFVRRVHVFHRYCDEMRVDAAFDLAAQLEQSARTAGNQLMLGVCQARIGLFAQAERSLSGVLSSFPPPDERGPRVVAELATVKNHLGKIAEGAALEKQLYLKNQYTIEDPTRAAFVPIFREKMLEDGESVAGKRVFVVLGGGLGDAIEQLRNIDNLLAEGAREVFVNTPEPLHELVSNSALRVTQQRGIVEELAQCDCIAIGNMLNWRYWRDGAVSAKRTDYLRPVRPRETQIEVLPQPGKRKIGIVWRSTNATWLTCRHEPFRSMALSTLEPLLADPHGRFYSLQFGALTPDEQTLLARYEVVDASPAIRSFADLADIVMQLDLVITIDSAAAHLCGALGVPVWNLLAGVSDWRWGDAAQRATPLYASMRLFRQRALGDWEPVIADVAAELAQIELAAH
jgi:hypothetical protein